MHAVEKRSSRAAPDGDTCSANVAHTSPNHPFDLARPDHNDRVRRSLLRGRNRGWACGVRWIFWGARRDVER